MAQFIATETDSKSYGSRATGMNLQGPLNKGHAQWSKEMSEIVSRLNSTPNVTRIKSRRELVMSLPIHF